MSELDVGKKSGPWFIVILGCSLSFLKTLGKNICQIIYIVARIVAIQATISMKDLVLFLGVVTFTLITEGELVFFLSKGGFLFDM